MVMSMLRNESLIAALNFRSTILLSANTESGLIFIQESGLIHWWQEWDIRHYIFFDEPDKWWLPEIKIFWTTSAWILISLASAVFSDLSENQRSLLLQRLHSRCLNWILVKSLGAYLLRLRCLQQRTQRYIAYYKNSKVKSKFNYGLK